MEFSRRRFLKSISSGFGYLAFAGLSTQAAAKEMLRAGNPLAPKAPHFPSKAKHVIFLCMQGGPSHVDSFDYKPALYKDNGKPGKYGGQLLKPLWEYKQRGKSGLWISDLFPEVAKHADDMCLIRSMQCDQPVHPGAMLQMHTGTTQFVRPSLGAWTTYGLGTENDSLPGFVALSAPGGGARNFGSAFLPAIYGGTTVGGSARNFRRVFGGGGEDQVVPDIKNSKLSKAEQRRQLNYIQMLNRDKLAREQHQPGVEAAIESFELGYRMQDVMPGVMDTKGESQQTLDLYGVNDDSTAAFGKQCLLARRFVEAGVRFVEVTHGGWDHHTNLLADHKANAVGCDKPIAGLLADLKQRGLLDETLVVWAGEFGRTPAAQNGDGRDHNNKGYTTWMAGGGVKGGFSYGSTDEYGYEAVDGKCHIHDWHATILYLLGMDHEKLTYRYGGRDFRLTDVYGEPIREIVA